MPDIKDIENNILDDISMANSSDYLQEIKIRELGKKGRILIRPSGTEPLVRVMVEGQDREQSSAIAEELSNIAKLEGIA